MKFKTIFSLIILISCLNVNKNETNFDSIFSNLYSILDKEINNFISLDELTREYMTELQNQKNYIRFIQTINSNYYYPFPNQKISLNLKRKSSSNLINNTNCIYNFLLISDQRSSILCLNDLYNSLSLYNLTSEKELNSTLLFQIPLSINLNYSNDIYVSFSAFDEEETKIIIFNRENIFSIHLKLNYSLDNFKISYINNFTIANYSNDNLLYISTTLYHGNRYILYGYENGEFNVYLLKDKFNDSYISLRTMFNLNQRIYKIYQIQGYLFIIYENRKKIRILSLLGSNSILINCYSFNEIIDILFDYKNNLLYILDNKGTLIIKELSLSVSKAYTNTCNSIYTLQIPDYVIQNDNDSNGILKLIMAKNTNFIYILGKNYLGYINNKFELENYIIFNNNEHIYDNNVIFSKGNTNYLITKYQKEIIVYEINQIKNEKIKIDKTNYEKEKPIYNIIDDNSGIVECNGNMICKLLFNSFTNNKYTINTLYITCIVIIISTVYYFRKNSQKNKNYKSFKEDDLDKEEKGSKFSKMFEKMKNINNFEMFSDYKKRQRNNNINNNRQEEEYKDYYGDEDDNNNEKENEENEDEFLSKAYHNYLNNMMKKKMEKDENDNDNEEIEDEYEEEDNYIEKNEENNTHQYEERKGHSSDDN